MNEVLEDTCIALEALATQIRATHGETKSYVEVNGWNFPAISASDLAYRADALSRAIRNANIESPKEELIENIKPAPDRLTALTANTAQYLAGNHALQAIPAIAFTLNWIDELTRGDLYLQDLENPDRVPIQLVKRVRSINAQLDDAVTDQDKLTDKINLINNAFEAAQALPTDRQALDESRSKIEQYLKDSTTNESKISELTKKLSTHEANIEKQKLQAEAIVKQCEDAYRIATTTGLAGAFDARANSLANSMWIWTGGLVISLIAAIFLGSSRLEVLSATLKESDPSNFIVVVQLFLSIVGLGAPVWFAWISTKQLGQRFRLAEDYAFKASVAKAYEGYRSEATKIDKNFTARLFSSTLDRLEEEPLRLIDTAVHSSPLEEVLASEGFSKAIEKDPKIFGMLESLMSKLKPKKIIAEKISEE